MSNHFYRVSNESTQQGLWYDYDGRFTGFIHNKFKFCQNNELAMDYDDSIVGWLSAADSLEGLYKWFSKEDILQLQEHNYFIHKFETKEYKFYDRFQHYVINQKESKVIEKIVL